MFKPTIIEVDTNKEAYLVPEFNGYAITADGELYSNKLGKWNTLNTPVCKSTGYKMVCLTGEASEQKTFGLHRLLYVSAVSGHLSRLTTVDHINGNKLDNRLENLQAISFRDNLRKGKNTILTVNQVKSIWNDFNSGVPVSVIAAKNNVKISSIYNITNGHTWNDITGLPIKQKKKYYIPKPKKNTKAQSRALKDKANKLIDVVMNCNNLDKSTQAVIAMLNTLINEGNKNDNTRL